MGVWERRDMVRDALVGTAQFSIAATKLLLPIFSVLHRKKIYTQTNLLKQMQYSFWDFTLLKKCHSLNRIGWAVIRKYVGNSNEIKNE